MDEVRVELKNIANKWEVDVKEITLVSRGQMKNYLLKMVSESLLLEIEICTYQFKTERELEIHHREINMFFHTFVCVNIYSNSRSNMMSSLHPSNFLVHWCRGIFQEFFFFFF